MVKPFWDRQSRFECQSPILFLMTVLFVLSACQGSEPGPTTVQSTDSAGITIVSSTDPLWGDGEGWVLSPEPEVVIGEVEGDERYILDQVAGARRLSDGRIAVLDVGSRRVRLYDPDGNHLFDLGGDGDGPSEFRTPQFLGLVSDTLVVYEYFPASLTWFAPDGGFLRTSTVFDPKDGEIPRAMTFGYLDDRFGVGIRIIGDRERPHVEGLNRHPTPIWRFDLSGQGADSLLSVPGTEEIISFPNPRAIHHRLYVFGNTAYLAASKNWIYVAPTDDFSVQVYDPDGALHRIIRRNVGPRSVTPSDIDQYVEERLSIIDPPAEERGELEKTMRAWQAAGTVPAFRSVVVDSEDNLWVEEWEDVGLGQGPFSVFRPDGAWLGNIDLPEGLPSTRGGLFQPWIEIGPDYLLGVWVDEYRIEQVRLYGLEK